MSDERHPIGPWIAALLIALPVLYVASLGPACWIEARQEYTMARTIYQPICQAGWRVRPVANALIWYANLGSPENVGWEFDRRGELSRRENAPLMCIDPQPVTFAAPTSR